MREITTHKVNGCNDAITVTVRDEPGSGGACHHYRMAVAGGDPTAPGVCQEIFFQNGPIKEAGGNGITHEALLAILIDRLQGFQSGPYACQANQAALDAILVAQGALKGRTQERLARGVEGTHAI